MKTLHKDLPSMGSINSCVYIIVYPVILIDYFLSLMLTAITSQGWYGLSLGILLKIHRIIFTRNPKASSFRAGMAMAYKPSRF